MHKVKYPILAHAAFIASLIFTPASFGDQYYRWVGADGVVHYGSRPPEGVEAERVSTYGKAKADSATKGKTDNGKNIQGKSFSEKQQEILKKRQAQCEQERSRLSTLKTTGSRIQMQEADGTKRYLSPEEVVQEISNSERFINEACKS